MLHSGSVICSHGSHNLGNCTQPSQPSPAQPSSGLHSPNWFFVAAHTLHWPTGTSMGQSCDIYPPGPHTGSLFPLTRLTVHPGLLHVTLWSQHLDTQLIKGDHLSTNIFTEKSPHKHTKTDTADKLKLQMLAGGIKIPSCPRLFCHTFKRYFSEISIDPVFVNNQNCYKRNSARSKQRSAEAEQRGGEHSI